MNNKTLVVEYEFEDPTANMKMIAPNRNERAFLARLLNSNDSAVTAVTGLGLTNVKIYFKDWSITDLFDGGNGPDDPIRSKDW